jgi:proteasome ATPase
LEFKVATVEEQLRNKLEEAKQKLIEMERVLKQFMTPPFALATILATEKANKKNMALFFVDGKMLYSEVPEKEKVKPGDVVFANPDTGALVMVSKTVKLPGTMGTVSQVLEETVEVDVDGHKKFMHCGVKVEEGDRVVVDPSLSVVYQNLGKSDKEHIFTEETGVCWSDIGGLEDAKTALKEAIEIPYKHKDLYKEYGRKLTKGVLIYGPPGCGKTMLGKATATSLAEIHGKKNSAGFIYVKGPELLNKWVGESEAGVRRIFESAREHYKKNNYPAVIFIDEAEAILGSRDFGRSGGVGSMSQTVVPMFLAEMDGLEESGAMVLLSTNRPQDLDPAIVRDGRVDRKVRVSRPDRLNTDSIFNLYLRNVPSQDGKLAKYATEELFDSKRVMFEVQMKNGLKKPLSLYQLNSGGLISGIVERAKELAMQRDIKAGVKCTGIKKSDIKDALDNCQKQMMELDHSHAIEETYGDLRQVVAIHKVDTGFEGLNA